MNRYQYGSLNGVPEMFVMPQGDYVKYSDHLNEIYSLKDRIKVLEERISDAQWRYECDVNHDQRDYW